MCRTASRLRSMIAEGERMITTKHLASIVGDVSWASRCNQLVKPLLKALWIGLSARVAKAGWKSNFFLGKGIIQAAERIIILCDEAAKYPEDFSKNMKKGGGPSPPTSWSDASKQGVGVVVCGKEFYQHEWDSQKWRTKKGALLMPFMEAMALLGATEIMLDDEDVQREKRMTCGIDSSTVLSACLRGRSTSSKIHAVILRIFTLVAKSRVDMRIVHVASEANPSDLPSRFFPLQEMKMSGVTLRRGTHSWQNMKIFSTTP